MSEGKGLLHILCAMVHEDDYVSDRRSVRLSTTVVRTTSIAICFASSYNFSVT